MATWDLFREMETFRREMDDVLRSSGFGRLLDPTFLPGPGVSRFPRINLREDSYNFYVDALIPGIDPKQLEMTVVKGTLTLSGERKENAADEKVTAWHRRERGAGKFLRTIDIPVDIDSEKVKAEYRDGVLRVTLPKAEAAKPKRIEVQVG